VSILAELIVSGVSLGFIYTLIALGFVIIFRATGVLNFAHGSMLLLGGYVIVRLQPHVGFFVAVAGGLVATALVATLIERTLIRAMRRRGADAQAMTIATIGLDILLLVDLTRRIGTSVHSLGDPWADAVVRLGPITVPQTRLVTIAVSVVLIVSLQLAFKFTSWGVSMRASAEDRETAALMGIRLGWVSGTAWTVAGALAAVGCVFLTAFPSPGLDNNTGLLALSAVPAAVVGGLDSVGGVITGGFIIGVVTALSTGYASDLVFLGQGFSAVSPWLVMLAVLLIRPQGLFGSQEATRV
jgi:branched-chain amino acid transport system permease protein